MIFHSNEVRTSMGRVSYPIPKHELVNDIESIIHHPAELRALNADARISIAQTGHLPNDEIWNYLTWRRDLDPARFDHYHPEFVGIFMRAEHATQYPFHEPGAPPTITQELSVPPPLIHQIPASMPTTTAPNNVGTGGNPSGVGPSFVPGSGSVPEPSSFLMLAVALVVAAIARAACPRGIQRGRAVRV
jgi:PEP-CTERM motif